MKRRSRGTKLIERGDAKLRKEEARKRIEKAAMRISFSAAFTKSMDLFESIAWADANASTRIKRRMSKKRNETKRKTMASNRNPFIQKSLLFDWNFRFRFVVSFDAIAQIFLHLCLVVSSVFITVLLITYTTIKIPKFLCSTRVISWSQRLCDIAVLSPRMSSRNLFRFKV